MAITVPTPESEVDFQPTPQQHEASAAGPEAFGYAPGVAQAETQLGQEAGKLVVFAKLQADHTRVDDATAKLGQAYEQLLHNPQTGLLSLQGENAWKPNQKGISPHQEAQENFRKAVNNIGSDLGNQDQKGMFAKIADKYYNDFNRTADAHLYQQQKEHEKVTVNAVLSTEQNRAALGYGDQQLIVGSLEQQKAALQHYSDSNGMGKEWLQDMTEKATSATHEGVLTQMIHDPNFFKTAKTYFKDHKSEMSADSQDRVEKLFDVIPRQREELQKKQETEFYKTNMRKSMLDLFDGKLTLSEVQRRFRDGQLDKSDYNLLESKLSKPDAAIMRSFMVSDPEAFNEIRQAQLNGSKSPGEIQRMIAKGAVSKDITPVDGKYLLEVNSENPPTPRDKYIESQANNLRDFGNRYFAETNFFGMATNKEKTNQESEQLVSDFYGQVDKARASGEDIDAIRDQVLKTASEKRFPGLGKLEKMPDVVIDVKGRVTRLLNPDQHSGLKPRYKITLAGADIKEEK